MTPKHSPRPIATLLLALSVAIAPAARGQSNDALAVELQSAIQKEMVQGDLKGALTQYRNILNRARSNRDIAARALVRIGQCQEKLGIAEARQAYERVVREFGDQAAAAEARSRLAALGGASAESGDRVILESADMAGPRSSRDGRYFVYLCSGQPGQSLCLVDTVTNAVKMVLKAQPKPARYWRPLPSPDGQTIAYTYFGNEAVEGKGDLHTLRVGEAAGRPLITGSKDAHDYFSAVDWTADGKAVLVAKTTQHSSGLFLVPVDGSTPTALNTPDFDWASGRDSSKFSPDGKWIAYPAIKGGSKGGGYRPTDVNVMPAAGGPANAVFTGGGSERVVGWLTNGDLVATSDRTGKFLAYRIRMSGGQAQGEPQLINEDLGDTEIVGVNPTSSSLYLLSQDRKTDLYIFQSSNDELRRFANGFQGGRPSFSPDQTKLAYASGGSSNTNFLVVRDMASGEERRMPTAIPTVQSLAWYPDNRHVLAICNSGNWAQKPTFRIDTATGETKKAASLPLQNAWWTPAILNDGKTLVVTARDTAHGNAPGIQALDLETGDYRVLFRPRSKEAILGSLTISRDGSTIAFIEHNLVTKATALLISPVENPSPKVIAECPSEDCQFVVPYFTPDAKTIVFRRGARPNSLWQIPVSGGEPKPLREIPWTPDGPAFHQATGQIIVGGGGETKVVLRQKSIRQLAAR
jgi:Tol biopolymer transport system component